MSKTITARWDLDLYVECPHCDNTFDVMRSGDACDILSGVAPLESGVELDLTCPECGENFEAKTVY